GALRPGDARARLVEAGAGVAAEEARAGDVDAVGGVLGEPHPVLAATGRVHVEGGAERRRATPGVAVVDGQPGRPPASALRPGGVDVPARSLRAVAEAARAGLDAAQPVDAGDELQGG